MLSFKKYRTKKDTKPGEGRLEHSLSSLWKTETETQMMNIWGSLRCGGADRMISKRGKELKDIAEIRDHSDNRGQGG